MYICHSEILIQEKLTQKNNLNMEKLFYYTGAIVWIAIALFIIGMILIVSWNEFKATVVWHWIDVQLSKIRYNVFGKNIEISKSAIEALQSRLDSLKEKGERKFEQQFLIKFIAKQTAKKDLK